VTPLEALSAALGVYVTAVRRACVHVNGRWQQHANAWWLALPDARFGLEDPEWFGDGRPWSRPVKSRELRSVWSLNRLAAIWGRDPALPPLDKRAGRTALRLLHEHIESTIEGSNR
jgi:hypothetical protein